MPRVGYGCREWTRRATTISVSGETAHYQQPMSALVAAERLGRRSTRSVACERSGVGHPALAHNNAAGPSGGSESPAAERAGEQGLHQERHTRSAPSKVRAHSNRIPAAPWRSASPVRSRLAWPDRKSTRL